MAAAPWPAPARAGCRAATPTSTAWPPPWRGWIAPPHPRPPMPADVVEVIFSAFAERGGDSYGENVSQLDHALQCAQIAQEDGADDPMIAAALLHDYGHFFEGRGDAAERDGVDMKHEAYGARLLRRWFGPGVVGPIALHVAAKRYLCAIEPGYEAALSQASVLSL